MKNLIFKLLLILALMNFTQNLSAQFGKGVQYMPRDSSFSMKFNFRMQSLYEVIYDEVSESFSSNFLIRRSRLKFGGFAYSPNVEYKVELGLSNRDISTNNEDGNGRGGSRIILDAVLKWKFSKHWTLWVGQTKLPGNRERVISSANLQFVDRSRLNSRLNIDRDAGIQLRGKFKSGDAIIKPTIAISMGEGRNITQGNFGGYDYTGRIEFLPLGDFKDYESSDLKRNSDPKLSIGVTYDYNDRAVRQGGQLGRFIRDSTGVYAENSLSTIFIDAMFKYQGISVMSEFGTKKMDKQIDGLSSDYRTGTAFNLQAGYLFKNNWEIAARYTIVRTNDEMYSSLSDENRYTFGLSRYVSDHNLKFQTDITRIEVLGSDNGRWQFRMQSEMQF
jgi:hypothetical protein